VGVPKFGVFRYIEDQTTETMKNERSIEELLADMLRKQDRQEELLKALVDGQSRIVDVQTSMMETQIKMAESQVQTNERLDSLNNRFERLIEVLSNNWFQRIIALEDEVDEIKRKVG
jgi:hypothetical protein